VLAIFVLIIPRDGSAGSSIGPSKDEKMAGKIEGNVQMGVGNIQRGRCAEVEHYFPSSSMPNLLFSESFCRCFLFLHILPSSFNYLFLVEASETRGTTALVYCLINSSLYTGTVQGWWSTPQLVRRSVGV
jgi:hypothetical protein